MRRRAREASNEHRQGNHYTAQVNIHHIFQLDLVILSNEFQNADNLFSWQVRIKNCKQIQALANLFKDQGIGFNIGRIRRL